MLFSDVHTHTNFCDGIDNVEQIVVGAIDLGLKTIGISTHGPLPFKAKYAIDSDKIKGYVEIVNNLKSKYKDKIEVLLGMEMDYFIDTEFSHIDKNIFKKLDYWIGSMHFLGRYDDGTPWTVDASTDRFLDGIKHSYGGNAKKAILDYYGSISKMVSKYNPTIVGHLDLVKKTNVENIIFNEEAEWYRCAVCNCLNVIENSKTAVEINTGAISRGYRIDQYPSDWILKEIAKRNIPVIVNSDAHQAKHVAYDFNNMYSLIKKLEIKNTVMMTGDGFKNIFEYLK